MTIAQCVFLFKRVPKRYWNRTDVMVSLDGKQFYSPCEDESGMIELYEELEGIGGNYKRRSNEALALLPHNVNEVFDMVERSSLN